MISMCTQLLLRMSTHCWHLKSELQLKSRNDDDDHLDDDLVATFPSILSITSSHDGNHDGTSSAAPTLSITRLEMYSIERGGDDYDDDDGIDDEADKDDDCDDNCPAVIIRIM